MALDYINQSKLIKLAAKASQSLTNNRLSDLQRIVYGGRGNAYDELQYLRHQNTDVLGVDENNSDAWNTFATTQGVTGSRSDQEKRDFLAEKSFP